MASEKWSNLGESTLSGAYTSGGASISVTSAAGFPTTGVFRVRLDNANKTIYRVDSVAGTTFAGGAEVNDGNANNGATVVQVISRQSLERLIQSPDTSSLHAPSGVSAADFYGPTWKLPPLDQSGWTWTNQGGASITQSNSLVYFSVPTAATENLRLRTVAAPATPYKFAAALFPNPMFQVNFQLFGVCLRESGTGKVVSLLLECLTTGWQISQRKNTSPTVVSTTGTTGLQILFGPVLWLRVGADGTNITLEHSSDGLNYTTRLSEAKATFFTTAPDEVGIVGLNFNSTVTQGADYLAWVQT